VEIRERLRSKSKKKSKYLNLLLQEFLKNDKAALDIYRLWLMSDLGSDNHIYEIDEDLSILKGKEELEVINSLLQDLPPDAREYFTKIFYNNPEYIDVYLESLFDRFGTLKVTKANFLEKGK
jgi:selenophosphate synthase